MAVGSPPTVRRRQLGRELRRLRDAAGIRADQLAERLRCSASRISRIEMARVRIAPGTVHEILDVLEVHGPERVRLVGLAREADQAGWWQAYADALPPEYVTYIAMESEASRLQVVEPLVVYGLLQTESYARAVNEQGGLLRSSAAVEARNEARIARQARLTGPNPPHLHVVMDEAALHHVIGSRRILADQLRYLVRLAGEPNITMQILPFDRAGVLVFFAGSAVVMDFPEPDDGRVMYLENLAGGAFVERQDTIDEYLALYRRLVATALDPADSAKKIVHIADGLVDQF